jgi:aldose sugar dehydrogenase
MNSTARMMKLKCIAAIATLVLCAVGYASRNVEAQPLFHFNITGNRQKVGVDDARLEDRVADNNAKFDITESESLLFGRNFGVGTDVQMGPNGNLYVVSLDRGVIYEVFKK